MTDLQKATCEGKKKYLTYEHARYDAKDIRNKYNVRVDVYHCPVCNYWHVGGQHGLDGRST